MGKELNNAWRKTCKVIFGDGVGDLEEFSSCLLEYVEPTYEKESELSEKKVIVSSNFPESTESMLDVNINIKHSFQNFPSISNNLLEYTISEKLS